MYDGYTFTFVNYLGKTVSHNLYGRKRAAEFLRVFHSTHTNVTVRPFVSTQH